jgi:hypothetical protein
MKEIYISTDIEADGPIPGPHSMLSIGWAAYTAHKVLVSTFSANVETLSDAQPHPKTCRMVGKAARGMGRLSQRSGASRARDDAIRDTGSKRSMAGPYSLPTPGRFPPAPLVPRSYASFTDIRAFRAGHLERAQPKRRNEVMLAVPAPLLLGTTVSLM